MKKAGIIAFSLGTLLLNSSAFAYVPPSQFIVKSLAGKRSGIKSIRIKNVITALEKGQPKGPQFRETVWIDYTLHLLRSRMVDGNGRVIYSIERHLDAGLPIGDLLLFDSQAEALGKGLRQSGIPIRSEAELLVMKTEEERRLSEITSIARLKGVTAWVIGNPSSGSQLWVEKDTFLPMKVIVKSDEKNFELNFDGYHFVKEVPYPKTMILDHFMEQGKEQEGPHGIRIESGEMLVNADMSEMRSNLQPGFTEDSHLDSETNELVRHFYQLVR